MEDKKYNTYLLYFYDENIEEENTCGQTLSLEKAKEQEEYGTWVGGIFQMNKEQILKQVWDKDDVDIFVSQNLECSEWTFKINKNDDFRGYLNYNPIEKKREYRISSIFH
jgi:hypothetical protein